MAGAIHRCPSCGWRVWSLNIPDCRANMLRTGKLTRIIHGPGDSVTRCAMPSAKRSEGKWLCCPRLRFGLI